MLGLDSRSRARPPFHIGSPMHTRTPGRRDDTAFSSLRTWTILPVRAVRALQ